jgi:hypothetical protein
MVILPPVLKKEVPVVSLSSAVLGIGALALVASGCSWTDKIGTHHLIVGIGFAVVTSTNRTGVEIRDDQALGLMVGPDSGGVGWMRHHRVVIDPERASNTVVSVKATPFSLTIKNFDPYSTQPKNPKQTKEGN